MTTTIEIIATKLGRIHGARLARRGWVLLALLLLLAALLALPNAAAAEPESIAMLVMGLVALVGVSRHEPLGFRPIGLGAIGFSLLLMFAPAESGARDRSLCGVVDWPCGAPEEMACEVSPTCDPGSASFPFDSWDPISCLAGSEEIDRFCYDCCGIDKPGGAAGCNSGLVHSDPADLVGGSIGPCHTLLPDDAPTIDFDLPFGLGSYSFDPPSSVDLVDVRGICSRADPIDLSGASREPWPATTSASSERTTIFAIHGRGSSCNAAFSAALDDSLYDRNQLIYCVEYDNSPATTVRVLPVLQDRTGDGPASCVGSGSCQFDTANPMITLTASPFSVEGVADAVARAMLSVPTDGDITLLPHSQGGFVARALLHRHYDDLRWQGKEITRVVSLGHPYFGVLTDPSLATGWACFEKSTNFRDCHVSRWLWGWQEWLIGGTGDAIDNGDFPQITWSAIAGDGALGNTANALSGAFPGACIEVFGGASVASVMGDGVVPILSSLGLDEHNYYAIESLDFDQTTEAIGCNHDAGCILAGAVTELGDDLLARSASRPSQGSLTFGGNEQVAIVDPTTLAAVGLPANGLSIEAWVRPATTDQMIVLSKGGEYQLESRFGGFALSLGGFLGADVLSFSSPNGSVPTDVWTHVAVTYANGTAKGYVNGELSAVEMDGALFDDDSAHDELRIGGREDGTLNPMFGSLDEIRIWHRELTIEEVRAGMAGDPGAGDQTALQAWWRFDEESGDTLVESSPSGFDASLANFPDRPWRTGAGREIANGALYFDGVDDRTVVDDPAALTALEMSDALTVEAWVNPRGTVWGAIVSKEGEYQLSRLSDGTVGFTLASASPGWTTRTTGVPLPEREWTHLALVFDGSQARVFMNGALVFSEPTVGPIGDFGSHAAEDEVWFGGRQWNLRNANPVWFGGLIDEVRIWNRVRTAQEIRTDLFQELDPPSELGLAGYWRFNERDAVRAFDASGSGHALLGGGASSAEPKRGHTRAVPEPATGLGLAIGGSLLIGLARRRRR